MTSDGAAVHGARLGSGAAAGDECSLLLLGGANLIARYLLRRLEDEGRGAQVVARQVVDVPPSCTFRQADVRDAGALAPPGSVVVSVLPLAVLVGALGSLEGIGSLVALSSTSRWSKDGSRDAHDRAIARGLAEAEAALVAWCRDGAVRYTILRPTLVYDGIEDRNVARMRRFIRRFGLLPIAAPARGLRQPIHADDVAAAILKAIGNPAAADRAFDIAGGETLTYRSMAERAFAAEGRRPRFIALPVPWLEGGFRVAARCGLLRPNGVALTMFRRMNQDLVFDVAPGRAALQYPARRFELPAVSSLQAARP